jgi:hypothetical protein
MLLSEVFKLDSIFLEILAVIIKHKLVLVSIKCPELSKTAIVGLFDSRVFPCLIFLQRYQVIALLHKRHLL